jgi:hypothetical protein
MECIKNRQRQEAETTKETLNQKHRYTLTLTQEHMLHGRAVEEDPTDTTT